MFDDRSQWKNFQRFKDWNINNKYSRLICRVCSKLAEMALLHWHILAFLVLTLNKYLVALYLLNPSRQRKTRYRISCQIWLYWKDAVALIFNTFVVMKDISNMDPSLFAFFSYIFSNTIPVIIRLSHKRYISMI